MGKKNKYVKGYDGKLINIKQYRKSLEEYPMYARMMMGKDGRTSLTNATFRVHKCGCKIIGCGTLQFPLEIDFCKKHSSK